VKRNLEAKKPIAAKTHPHTAEKTKRQDQACIPTGRLDSQQQNVCSPMFLFLAMSPRKKETKTRNNPT
jgi:hypothetical protein